MPHRLTDSFKGLLVNEREFELLKRIYSEVAEKTGSLQKLLKYLWAGWFFVLASMSIASSIGLNVMVETIIEKGGTTLLVVCPIITGLLPFTHILWRLYLLKKLKQKYGFNQGSVEVPEGSIELQSYYGANFPVIVALLLMFVAGEFILEVFISEMAADTMVRILRITASLAVLVYIFETPEKFYEWLCSLISPMIKEKSFRNFSPPE